MKRDRELERQILLRLEEHPHGFAPALEIPPYTDEQIGFHVYLMAEEGWLTASVFQTMESPSPYAKPVRLTPKGHDLVELAKDEAEWRKFASGQRNNAGLTNLTVNTAGGPALVNLGEIRGEIQQVVGTLNQSGANELADLLVKLASAIEGRADLLAGDRQTYLEQVKFIAERAAASRDARQPSVVKAVFESLRARLQDVADVAQILALVGPALADRLRIPWPFG